MAAAVGAAVAVADVVVRLGTALMRHAELVKVNEEDCKVFLEDLKLVRLFSQNCPQDRKFARDAVLEQIVAALADIERINKKPSLVKFRKARKYARVIALGRKRITDRISLLNNSMALFSGPGPATSAKHGQIEQMEALQQDGVGQTGAPGMLDVRFPGSFEILDPDTLAWQELIRELERAIPGSTNPDELALLQARIFNELFRKINNITDDVLQEEQNEYFEDFFLAWFMDDTTDIEMFRSISDNESLLFDGRALVGRGSMGELFSSSYEHEGKDEEVVIKLMFSHVSASHLRGAFYRQLYVHQELQTHVDLVVKDRNMNRLVRLYGAHFPTPESQEDSVLSERALVVMERMETDLGKAVAENMLSSESAILQVLSDIALGLLLLHSKGVGHFDLNPRHVLLKHEGKMLRAKLIDFGIVSSMVKVAEAASDTSIRASHELDFIAMHFGYRAPEVLRNDPLSRNFPADIWSLGALIWWLVSRQNLATELGNLESLVERANGRGVASMIQAQISSFGEHGHSSLALCEIAKDCLREEANERLDIVNVADRLLELNLECLGKEERLACEAVMNDDDDCVSEDECLNDG